MNLLDTHVLVWALAAPHRLSPAARQIIESNDIVISAASLWEMILKKGRPKEIIPDPLAWWKQHVEPSGVRVLPIELAHIRHLDLLPGPSKEPFDRILMCQCIVNGLRLVTKDSVIRDHYQALVTCVW